MTWYRWVVDYGKERQERFLTSLGLDDISWSRLTSLLFVGVLLVMLVYAFLLWRPKKSVDPALALYLRFCHQLARAGLAARAPHEGALDFARRCARQRPDLKDRVDGITERYVHCRYSNLDSVNELRALKREVSAFRA
jgi:protein-glutamine gamma-glutamyltransferase